MNKATFVRLVSLIADHEVFQNNSRNPQKPVWIQLMVVLQRLGCNGNGSSIGSNARYAGIGNGTVCKFTDRVFYALISKKDDIIKWPNAIERAHISKRFELDHGLPNAVGIVDGTHCIFAQKPRIDGEVYWSRKCCYSINLQLVCDDNKIITYYQTGFPGSVYDSTIFSQSKICKAPQDFFSPGQFLLADSGYASTNYICTPYRQPYASIPHNKDYNDLFSSARTFIEHVNGILKGRWSSLRGLRTQIKKKEDLKILNTWIVVCLILHNLMIQLTDEWTNYVIDSQQDIISNVEQIEIVSIEEANNNNVTATDLRLKVQSHLLSWHYTKLLNHLNHV
jgi:hypothetical protein